MRIPKQDSQADTNKVLAMHGNQLDKFRTYAYHHIVAVCNSRDLQNIATAFEQPDQVRKLFNTPTIKDEFGFRNPLFVNDDNNPGNKFFILCNGMQDVDIVVDSLTIEMDAAAVPTATGANALTSALAELVLKEPHGIKLLNLYRAINAELGVIAQDATTIIKTIFVGETYQGTIEYVIDIPPLYTTMIEFKLAVNEMGSTYTLTLLQAVGGIAHQTALSTSTNGQNLRGSGSIRDMLNSLAKQYTDDAAANLKALPPEVAKGKLPIQYSVVFDKDIEHVGGWTTDAMRNARQSSAGGGQPTVIPANISFDGAIAYVFESCAEYLKQVATDDPKKFVYKIVSTTVSTPTEVKIVYRIVPKYINRQFELIDKMKQSEDPEEILLNQKNVIIYDYIYTGKNTDIEAFDMHIDEGSDYFQTITTVQTLNSDYRTGTTVTSGVTTTSGVATVDGSDMVGLQGSVGPGANSNQQRSANQGLTQLKETYAAVYDRTWSVAAAKAGVVLRTRGHTGWLSRFALNPYDVAVAENLQLFDKIPDVYLNIMMPSTSMGTYSNTTAQTYERFWYKGLWSVLKTINTFSDGVFSTTLEMLAINSTPIGTRPTTEPTSGTRPAETRDVPSTPSAPVPSRPFVAGSVNGKPAIATASNDLQLTKNFTLGHFTVTSKVPRGQNQPASQDILDNIANLASVLQGIKESLGIPITVTSGYRNEIVNRLVGGAADSDHKRGEAADFSSSKLTPKQIVDAIIALRVPFKQLILEEPPGRNPWVHIAVSRSPSANKNTVLHWQGGKYLPYKG